ncbi:MAG: hypothetical protein NC120_09910, partial [Ruminococcus sp.]|nr:hypothetical protein [Ruminococcus sp.]
FLFGAGLFPYFSSFFDTFKDIFTFNRLFVVILSYFTVDIIVKCTETFPFFKKLYCGKDV